MAFIPKFRMILLCIVLLIAVGVGATSNFNNDNTGRNSPYVYSEIQSLDFDVMYEDADATSSYNDFPLSEVDSDDFEDRGASPSIVSSSVLYDGECYVSSEAMMCNGGGGDNMFDRILNYDDLLEDDDGEPTDDDDDDDNDGHSSMLSTASLLRSKSTTRREQRRCYAGSTSTSSKTQHNTHVNKAVRLNNALQLYSCSLQQHDRRRQQQLKYNFMYQQRTETIPFLRQGVFAVARGASIPIA